MQKIAFIPNRHWPSPEKRGSSLMRACVISSYMQKNFDDKIEARYSRSLPSDFYNKDIVVFVKDSDHEHIRKSKERGCITVYDPIDATHAFKNNDKFDLMIASSEAHAKIISKNHEIDLKRIVHIDHLHTNVYRKKSKVYVPSDVFNVGYVGVAPKLGLNDSNYKKFVNYLNEDRKFHLKETSTLDLELTLSEEGDVKNLYEAFENIHVGLSLYDEKLENRRKSEKPSTKMSAYSSYSIPCIATYQDSYQELISTFPQLSEFMADDIDHAISLVKKLANDYDYYVESRKLFDSIGESFHMKNSYELYIEQINRAYAEFNR